MATSAWPRQNDSPRANPAQNATRSALPLFSYHSATRGITSPDGHRKNREPEHTLSYWAAQVSRRILELENRCTGNRTVGSNPTLSANFLPVDVVGSQASFCFIIRGRHEEADQRREVRVRAATSAGLTLSPRVCRSYL